MADNPWINNINFFYSIIETHRKYGHIVVAFAAFFNFKLTVFYIGHGLVFCDGAATLFRHWDHLRNIMFVGMSFQNIICRGRITLNTIIHETIIRLLALVHLLGKFRLFSLWRLSGQTVKIRSVMLKVVFEIKQRRRIVFRGIGLLKFQIIGKPKKNKF